MQLIPGNTYETEESVREERDRDLLERNSLAMLDQYRGTRKAISEESFNGWRGLNTPGYQRKSSLLNSLGYSFNLVRSIT
jgi:hypothetical protein